MGIEIVGSYYNNPDALEPINDAWAVRDIEELRAAARTVEPGGVLVITEPEFEQIKRQVSLSYKWSGVRIFVR